MERLDRIYSQYIRLKEAGSNGYIKCYCCGESVFWKEAQNMHFMGRRHTNTRYLDLNCHAGCFECNVTKSGNLKAYQEHLIRDHGEEVVYTLKTMANTYMKYSKTELEGLIRHYKNEVKRLKKEKGL